MFVESWKLGIDFTRKVKQELAKRLENYEEFFCEETNQVRRLKIDELSIEQERNPITCISR